LGTAEFEAFRGYALNNDSDVAGTGYNSAHERNGFLYENSDGLITDLGSLGNRGSYAWGINDNDVVVGQYENGHPVSGKEGDQYAFVWENGTMYDLLDQVSDRTFWLLFSANDVNEHGEIVGNGRAGKRNDSQEHGFLARPEGGGDQQPPDAVDDSATTDMDTPVTIDVLANDTDPENDPLGVTSVGTASNGAVIDHGDGTVTYTPNTGYTGPDSFSYTISDGNGGEDTATVTVTVRDPSAEPSYPSTDTPMPIADYHPKKGPGITESTITPDGTVQAVAVEVTLTHEAVAELAMSLISPTGVEVPLTPVISGKTIRYDVGLPGPETGAWTLRVIDSAKGNKGTLESWKLLLAPHAGGFAKLP
jgi:subtilisin-like proprotein convertase family protein